MEHWNIKTYYVRIVDGVENKETNAKSMTIRNQMFKNTLHINIICMEY